MRTLKLTLPILALLLPAFAFADSSCNLIQSYTAPGTYTASASGPVTIQVIGGGGGGGGGTWEDGYAAGGGGAGSASSVTGSFGTVTAQGGVGGAGQATGHIFGGPQTAGQSGANGAVQTQGVTLSSGDQLTVTIGGGGGGGGGGGTAGYGPAGASGSAGTPATGGSGGLGGSGTCRRSPTMGNSGHARSGGSGGVSSGGGGGGGSDDDDGNYGCAAGGNGGSGTLAQGGGGGMNRGWVLSPPPGGVAPGGGGHPGPYGGGGGGGGASGAVNICEAPVSCSITFDQNPLTGDSTTMHWSSTGNPTLFYINNVGYVGASGSSALYASGDYSGYVQDANGNTASCSAILTGAGTNSSCVAGSGSGSQSGSTGGGSAELSSYEVGNDKHSVPGECYNDSFSHAISPAAQYVLLDGTTVLAGGADFGTRVCQISHQGGSISQMQVFITNASGQAVYQSPTAVDCGSQYNSFSDGAGLYEDVYEWTDGPRHVDLDPAGVPYTISGQVSGCNGSSHDYLTTMAGVQVTEYGSVSAGSGGSTSGSSGSSSSSMTCQPNGNLQDSCGNSTVCRYGCSTQTNQCNTSEQCVSYNVCSTDGTKVVNTCDGSLVTDCAAQGEICSAGICTLPQISFGSFDALSYMGASFTATGHLQIVPNIVRNGQTVNVYWNALNAASCAIRGTNGDSWNGLFSGTSGTTTSPIIGQTTYTLVCQGLPGATPPNVTESQTVNLIPAFQEI